VNRLQKVLEDADIKPTAVASDVTGVSARAMLTTLLEGQSDLHRLADRA
jgi:transposase